MTRFSSGPLNEQAQGGPPLRPDQHSWELSARLIHRVDVGGALERPGRPGRALSSRLIPLDPANPVNHADPAPDLAGAPSLTTGTATGTSSPQGRGAPSLVGAHAQQIGGPGVVAPPVAFPGSTPGVSRLGRCADEAALAGELRAVYWEAIRAERTVCHSAPTVSTFPIVLVRFVAAVLPGAPLAPPLLAPPPRSAVSPGSDLASPHQWLHAARTLTDAYLFAQVLDDKIALALPTAPDRAWPSADGDADGRGMTSAAAWRQPVVPGGWDVAGGGLTPPARPPFYPERAGDQWEARADLAPPVLLLLDVAGLTLRVDAPEDWADALLEVLCRWCPALPTAAPAGVAAYSGADAIPARVARGVDHPWAFFDSSGVATLPLPHLGLTLVAPTSATLAMSSASPNPQMVVSDFLAQARRLLIHAACQRHGVQTHWAATCAEAEALLASWWPLA